MKQLADQYEGRIRNVLTAFLASKQLYPCAFELMFTLCAGVHKDIIIQLISALERWWAP